MNDYIFKYNPWLGEGDRHTWVENKCRESSTHWLTIHRHLSYFTWIKYSSGLNIHVDKAKRFYQRGETRSVCQDSSSGATWWSCAPPPSCSPSDQLRGGGGGGGGAGKYVLFYIHATSMIRHTSLHRYIHYTCAIIHTYTHTHTRYCSEMLLNKLRKKKSVDVQG